MATALAPDHPVPAYPHAGEHRGVVGDAHVVLEHGAGVGHVLLLHDAVGVAVDVGVVGDADPVAQGDAAAVVEQHVAVHHDVVAHLEVVAVGELDELEALEVAAAAGEEMLRQQPAEPHAQVHVLPAERRAVEAVPEPEQRLDPGEALWVDVGVVLGLEGDVARVEDSSASRLDSGVAGSATSCVVVAEAGIPELVQHVAGDAVPVGARAAARRSWSCSSQAS